MLDATAFVGRWPFYPAAAGDGRGLLAMMDRLGIERALVSPLNAVLYKDPDEGNEELWREVSLAPDRLLPVPCLNPTYPGWPAALERCIAAGARGIRLHPNYHCYAVNGAAAKDLACACAESGLFLALTLRLQDERQHHPRAMVPAVKVGEAAELVGYSPPKTRFLISMARPAEMVALAGAAGARRHLWFDTAGVQGPENVWERLTQAGLGNRLLFGTAWPLQYEAVAVAKATSMAMAEPLREGLLGGNWENLLRA